MLEGCWFTLTAVADDTEKADIAKLIRENGGRTFTEATLSLVRQRYQCQILLKLDLLCRISNP